MVGPVNRIGINILFANQLDQSHPESIRTRQEGGIMEKKRESGRSTSGSQSNVITFRPLKKKTFSDEIIDQILSMIVTGELNAGDKLPGERQLSESFKVSRSAVREALKTLENLGIVRRHPRGTTVCAPEEARYPSFSLAAANSTVEQIFELARILCIESVGLAAERATAKETKRMAKALRESRDERKALAHHYSFHRALVTWAQNPLLTEVANLVVGFVSQSERLSHAIQQWDEERLGTVLRNISDGQRRILKAIEAHDAPAAKRCMREHLDYLESVAMEEIGPKAGRKVKRGS